MKVSINKPCHENWDAMEPNEKGAFCLSCQKSVVDFSTKTTQEIKSFFKSIADTEKVCGRFKSEQLTELSFDDFYTRFKKWILPHKIAVIMFFVFGLTLFSCNTTKHEPLMGKVAIEEPVAKPTSVDTIIYESMDMKMGEVAMEPMPQPVISNPPKEIPNYIKGDVAFEPADTIKKANCVKKDSLPDKHIIMGKVMKVE